LDDHVPCDLGLHRLIAGLDVGEVEISDQIAYESQEFVRKIVAKIEHPTRSSNEKSRAQTNVSQSFPDRADQLRNFPRMVFQVRVLDHDNISGNSSETGPECSRFALIDLMAEKFNAWLFRSLLQTDFHRRICRSIIDYDHFVDVRIKFEDAIQNRTNSPPSLNAGVITLSFMIYDEASFNRKKVKSATGNCFRRRDMRRIQSALPVVSDLLSSRNRVSRP
jgi:hypothetical protein